MLLKFHLNYFVIIVITFVCKIKLKVRQIGIDNRPGLRYLNIDS